MRSALALAVLLCSASVAVAAPPPPRDPIAERVAAVGDALAKERRGIRAVALLAELGDLQDEAPDLARLATLYARVADGADALPEARALARMLLGELERSRGNLQRHAAQLKRLGYVTGWRAIGPFDDEGKRGFMELQPPERELLLDAVQPGKGGDVAWRVVPPDAGDAGLVNVGAVLSRSNGSCAHALALVESPHEERATLWFGASGAARVRVNGAVALEDRGYHPARPDQRGAQVSLRRGSNRIQVKLCSQSDAMGFYLRLVDGRGAPLALPNPVEGPLPPPLPPGTRPAPSPGVVEQLEARAAATARLPGAAGRRAEAEARLDLARVLSWLHPYELEERRALSEVRRAVALAPDDDAARLFAAALEEDPNAKREQLEAALAAAPDDPRVQVAVGEELAGRSRTHEAIRHYQRAVQLAPGYAAARVFLAVGLDGVGFESRAALLAAETAALLPTSPIAITEAARFARRLGRVEEATWLLRKAIALRFDESSSRDSLAQLLLERGDVDGAVALLAEGLRVRPGDLDALLRLADLLAGNGRGEEAEARYAEALRLAPGSAEPWERRGRARLRAGRDDEALADLHRALAIEPQRPGLKDRIRSLEPKREPWEAPYALDALALAKSPDDAAPDDDARVLGEVQVTRVFPSGLSSAWHQEVIRIRTQRGAEAWRRRSISYAPDRQDVEVIRVRVVKPDGTTTDTWDENESSESEPWYRLYYDTRTRTLVVPGLAAGDVLEVAWRVNDTARDNLLTDYFGDFTQVDGPTAKRRFDYVLLAPASRPIHANAPEGLVRTERTLADGLVEHRWVGEGIARVDPEPMMPPWVEVGRFLHLSTFASWDEVGRFYWGLVRDPLRVTPEIQAAADGIAAAALGKRAGAKVHGREEVDALVRAVYAFVVTQVRYVGLEFGIHGYKPYRVDQVLQRRFGDCKDKASLMHALLEAQGIESRLVLLRMRRLGAIPEAPASLAPFNHAILYVPSLDLWLDGTAAYTGSRELPAEDRGASVLVIDPGGAPRFGQIPEATPDQNVVASDYGVTLTAEGKGAVVGRWTITGAQASHYRRAYETTSNRRALVEQAFGRTWPAASVSSVEVGALGRIEEPIALTFKAEVPSFALREGEALRFNPFGNQRGYTERWAGLAVRHHPLELGDPNETRFTHRIALPRGWEAEGLPEPAAVDGPYGSFEVRYRAEPGQVVVEGRVVVKRRRVPVADYPAFRAFTAAADAAFARTVRVAPPARVQEAP
jgi:tetratricopeptide (TPR) repeat protein/transglutaminase-like putative cysteine protease